MNEKFILSSVIFNSKVIDDKERFFIVLVMLDPSIKGLDAVLKETFFPSILIDDERTEEEQVFDYAVNLASGNIEHECAEVRHNTQLWDFTEYGRK